jgi:predicted O-methyltransferase YrrM
LRNMFEAFRLAQQATVALYLDALNKRSFLSSQRARAAVRDGYFQPRARIPTVTLGEFLHQISPTIPDKVSLMAHAGLDSVGSSAYFHALASIASTLQPSSIVEFGTYLGASTLLFAMNSSAKILTIDLPDTESAGSFDTLNSVDKGHVARSRSRIGEFYKNRPEEKQITELRCDSRSLNLTDTIQSADLVYVDGGHDTVSISADTKNGFQVLCPGGVMLWDDYFWLYPDVVSFLDKLAEERNLVHIANTYLVGHVDRRPPAK